MRLDESGGKYLRRIIANLIAWKAYLGAVVNYSCENDMLNYFKNQDERALNLRIMDEENLNVKFGELISDSIVWH